jgi:hypothetical protein
MASNTQIQVANLDFADIKQNFINYLQSQSTFKDYNFTGSALSNLLDILSYNTQYNAFYLNMVANEMFLDSALQRSSVVSHAKLLNYVPQSAIGPLAYINVGFYGVTTPTYTIPKYTNFISGPVDNKNYNFVTTTSYTTQVTEGLAYFSNIELKQGTLETYTFTVDSATNPKYIFDIPDQGIDLSTVTVQIQESSSNTAFTVYNPTTDYLQIGSNDAVYYVQESITGNYQIYFGDGVMGKKLTDGNIITIKFITTSGTAAGQANSFTLMDSLGGYSSIQVVPYLAATLGKDKESIDSIKFQAPKAFASQGRAVSKNDYISVLQQNKLGLQFDSVSVWGGEENDPPAYGQVFVSLKPKGAYDLTETQKNLIVNDVLKPISVLTVTPTIVNPDYTYIQVNANVIYQQTQTNETASSLAVKIREAIYAYGANNLNTFNASLNSYDMLNAIRSCDPSIVSSDFLIKLQKKISPTFNTPTTYNLYFNTSLDKGLYQNGISSYPAISVQDPNNPAITITGVYIEEVPSPTGGVASISIGNPGFNYQSVPSITILGDGVGATANCTIVNGAISKVTVANTGSGYTSAIAVVRPAPGDTTGTNALLVVNLTGQYGTLRTYYNNTLNVKSVVDANVGVVDYINGTITLNNFNPVGIEDPLGQLTISVQPTTRIVSSAFNRIITINPYDPTSVTVKTIAKNS